jgi:L-aminopeptidase/D-esterase-like protein
MLPNERMNALFDATVRATAEAVIDALVVAETRLEHERARSRLSPERRLVPWSDCRVVAGYSWG